MAVKLYLIPERLLVPSVSFFVNTGKTSKIDKDKQFVVETIDVFGPALKAIKKYSAHPSILRIKRWITMCSLFEKSLMKKF